MRLIKLKQKIKIPLRYYHVMINIGDRKLNEFLAVIVIFKPVLHCFRDINDLRYYLFILYSTRSNKLCVSTDREDCFIILLSKVTVDKVFISNLRRDRFKSTYSGWTLLKIFKLLYRTLYTSYYFLPASFMFLFFTGCVHSLLSSSLPPSPLQLSPLRIIIPRAPTNPSHFPCLHAFSIFTSLHCKFFLTINSPVWYRR